MVLNGINGENIPIKLNYEIPKFQRSKKKFSEAYINWKKDAYIFDTQKEYGEPIDETQKRPLSGAYPIIPEDWIDFLTYKEKVLGLSQFATEYLNIAIYNNKPQPQIDTIYQEEGIGDLELLLYPAPLNCEVYFNNKQMDQQMPVQLIFVINFFDVQISEDDREKYARGICNWMNPLVLLRASQGKVTRLLNLLPNDLKNYYSSIIAAGANKEKAVIMADANCMKGYTWDDMLSFLRGVGSGHEIVHAQVPHMPDAEGSTPENNRFRAQFNYWTYNKIIERLIVENPNFKTSKTLFKNVIAAISSAREDQKFLAGDIQAGLAMEMACDRFDMYKWETYFKIQVCENYFSELFRNESATTDFLFKLEDARMKTESDQDPNAFVNFCKQFSNENVTDINTKNLSTALKQTEKSHAYVSIFGDPELFPEERNFFQKFLILLQELDKEGSIGEFNRKHFQDSNIIRITRYNEKSIEY